MFYELLYPLKVIVFRICTSDYFEYSLAGIRKHFRKSGLDIGYKVEVILLATRQELIYLYVSD